MWSPSEKAVIAGASELYPERSFVQYSPPKFRDIEGPSANAAHIAAANPAAVLELIARLRAAESDAARFRHVRECVQWRRAGGIDLAVLDFTPRLPPRVVSVADMRSAWTAAIDAAMKEPRP